MKISGINFLKILALASALAVSACGGGEKETTVPVTEDTDLLVRNAALHSSTNVGINVNGIVDMTNSSTVTSTLTKLTKSESLKSTSSVDKPLGKYDDQVYDYLLPTLEGGNATRSRNGNTITIDPDEYYVCQQWTDSPQQSSEVTQCASILADLAINITATSDDTGMLRFLYSRENLIVIEYAPSSGSYELFLAAARTLIQRMAEVTGENINLPESMTGAVKLSAEVDNAAQGREAGSLTISITQPIDIAATVDNEAVNFSLGQSRIIGISANAATGNGSLSIAVNALAIAIQNLMGADEAAISTIDMPDFTLTADLTNSGTEVQLSNVGMGRGPFRVAIENNDVITIALGKFSAHYNDLTREAEFFSSFDLDIAIEYTQAAFGWLGDGSSLRLSALIPAETTLAEQINGSTKVEQGGPFNFKASYFDGSGDEDNFEQDITFTAGQCFDESQYDQRLELVSCD